MKNTEPRGPVAPPSLGEVFEIATRRQRNRQRFMQGTLVAVAVAGIGLGIRTQRPDDTGITGRVAAAPDSTVNEDRSPVTSTTIAAAPTTTTTTTTATPTTTAPTTTIVEHTTCLLAVDDDTNMADWIAVGHADFFADEVVSYDEAALLADEWAIPLDEVKGLVGHATRNGVTLSPGSLDQAFDGWTASGHELEQLTALADEWESSTVSIKILRLIGGDHITASLAACGLS